MTKRLEGRKAIITGAASGIGEAIAAAFLREGTEVFGVDLPGNDFGSVFSEKQAHRFACDITGDNAPADIIRVAIDKMGGIDILVNNAGVAQGSSLETTTDELWDRVMALNVTSMFRLSRAAIPALKKSNHGRIINLGSIMSDMAGPELFVYGTSKHAVAGMTRSMAVDLGQFGITANYLQPGAIVTALSAPFFEDADFRQYWEEKAPLGRHGVPDDVAGAAVFLASDEARFVSGVGLNVDGGAIVKF